MASSVKTLKKQIADLNNQYLTKKGVVIGAKFKVTFLIGGLFTLAIKIS